MSDNPYNPECYTKGAGKETLGSSTVILNGPRTRPGTNRVARNTQRVRRQNTTCADGGQRAAVDGRLRLIRDRRGEDFEIS